MKPAGKPASHPVEDTKLTMPTWVLTPLISRVIGPPESPCVDTEVRFKCFSKPLHWKLYKDTYVAGAMTALGGSANDAVVDDGAIDATTGSVSNARNIDGSENT